MVSSPSLLPSPECRGTIPGTSEGNPEVGHEKNPNMTGFRANQDEQTAVPLASGKPRSIYDGDV